MDFGTLVIVFFLHIQTMIIIIFMCSKSEIKKFINANNNYNAAANNNNNINIIIIIIIIYLANYNYRNYNSYFIHREEKKFPRKSLPISPNFH